MAYLFNGSSQYLSCTSTPVSQPPFTFSAWIKPSAITASAIFAITNSTNADRHNLSIPGTAGTISAGSFVSGIGSQSTTTGTVSVGSWFHVAGVWSAANSRTSFLSGIAAVANTGTHEPSVTRMQLGARLIPTAGAYFSGTIADAAIWTAALTAEEIASLAKGVACRFIRPQSLVFYAPLIRNLFDIRGGLTITNNNTATVADHPRIYA